MAAAPIQEIDLQEESITFIYCKLYETQEALEMNQSNRETVYFYVPFDEEMESGR